MRADLWRMDSMDLPLFIVFIISQNACGLKQLK